MWSIISYDRLRDPEPTNDLPKKPGDIFVFDVGISIDLYPFTKIVSGHKKELFFEWQQWVRGQLCPFPIAQMAKGLWPDWGPQRACEEWGCAFTIDHTSRRSSQRLVLGWANSTLVNEHDVLRFVPLCDCHLYLHVAPPTHTMPLCHLSIWGTNLQRITCKGYPRSGWSEKLTHGSYELFCFLQEDLRSEDMSRFRSFNRHMPHWYCTRVRLLWMTRPRGRRVIILVPLRGEWQLF